MLCNMFALNSEPKLTSRNMKKYNSRRRKVHRNHSKNHREHRKDHSEDHLGDHNKEHKENYMQRQEEDADNCLCEMA
ncbi:hypothetical protein ACLKA6_010308 [Drosophila palustris]